VESIRPRRHRRRRCIRPADGTTFAYRSAGTVNSRRRDLSDRTTDARTNRRPGRTIVEVFTVRGFVCCRSDTEFRTRRQRHRDDARQRGRFQLSHTGRELQREQRSARIGGDHVVGAGRRFQHIPVVGDR